MPAALSRLERRTPHAMITDFDHDILKARGTDLGETTEEVGVGRSKP